MRILTWNFLHNFSQHESDLARYTPDLVVLTEFAPSRRGEALRASLAELGLVHQLSAGAHADKNAVLVASRTPIEAAPLAPPRIAHHDRLLIVRCEELYIGAFSLSVDNAKAALLDYIGSLEHLPALPSLLVGEFNAGRDSSSEEELGLTATTEYVERLAGVGWMDAWRHFYPHVHEYVGSSHAGNSFRIAHAFASESLLPRLASAEYLDEKEGAQASGHSLLIVDLDYGTPDVRVVIREKSLALEAPIIHWPRPYDPECEWRRVKLLPRACSGSELSGAIARVQADRRFFRKCRRCKERMPVGMMFEDIDLCHGCANVELGVVY